MDRPMRSRSWLRSWAISSQVGARMAPSSAMHGSTSRIRSVFSPAARSIVFTTVSNDQIFPGLSAYSGAKEAVAAFTKVLAAEPLPRGIRVNAIAPGFILTPTMGVAELTEEQRAEFIEQGNASTPMGRGGTVEEVAAAALYLAADATFTTGLELPVDGGFGQGLGH